MNQLSRTEGIDTGDPWANLTCGVILRAVQDAQLSNPEIREEAIAWLWVCCPDIAEKLGLPVLEVA